ncbi:MAG: T9SS type B sorting domain-containing protein [Sphingobacteriales bacterium]|nr:MAG: T9SS type B sorting domain-containing protein [Sphingobacteriales bacterium]
MRNFFSIFLLLLSFKSQSQNLSFTCPRDTVLGCGINCFDLVAKFPDFKELGDDYTLVNTSSNAACLPYVPPGAPGPSAQLTIDDRYSDVIPLPFPFPFYGTTYNALIVSTNGYVSFDVSNALDESHYDDEGDLPNLAYDRALIMGPYHDLDPSEPTSPSSQVKYQTFGTAPNRKWILSFYQVPLYVGSFSCFGLIRNTHQIILHETTGIIEVDIIDKEICTGWLNGKAMIGLQDWNKTKGIMAPNRRMSDPPWGSVGMNEIWRFYPSGGATLFRRVELLDGTGTTVAVGDTIRVDANNFTWTFPNICPSANTTETYVVKTTYAQANNPALTYFSLDTITVLRNAMPVSASTVSTNCGTSIGSITVTATGGTAPLTYTLNPGAVTNNTGIFPGLNAGIYTVNVTDATGTCTNSITATVTAISNLNATYTSTNAACPGIGNGSFTVTPSSGTAPFSFSANGGPVQTSGTFTNLDPGTYNVLFTDAIGCNGTVRIIIGPGNPITANSSAVSTTCAAASNGSITVTPTSGLAPYTFALNSGTAQTSNMFTGLPAGSYVITVRDSRGCSVNINRNVNAGAGLSGNIVQTPVSCPGNTDGSITVTPTNGVAPYSYSLNGGPAQASNIFPNLPASTSTPYIVVFTDANNCTGTRSINVGGGTAPSTTATGTNTSCSGSTDGRIVFAPIPGTVYTINPGAISNTTGIFNNLNTGTYTLSIATSGGCAGTVTPSTITIAAGPVLPGTTTTTTSCTGGNTGSITVTPVAAGTIYTLNPGAVVNTTGIFNNLAAGTFTVNFVTAAGCNGRVTPDPVITTAAALVTTATTTSTSCPGVNNGSVTVASVGTGTTYTLNPGAISNNTGIFAGLAAGTYNITFVTTAGCTGTVSPDPVVNAGPSLTSLFVQTNPVCANINDGVITITPQAGTTAPYTATLTGPGGPYSYTGNAPIVFNGLAPGSYNYTYREAGGCTGTGGPVTLVTNTPVFVRATITNLSCNASANGSVSFNPVGGVAPYQYSDDGGITYQTNNTFNGLSANIAYSFRIRDNVNCTKDTTITLTQPTVLTSSVTATTPAGCSNNDGTITALAAGGTAAYTYTITTGPTVNNTGAGTGIFTGLANGAYIITVTDAQGCTRTASTTVGIVDNMFLSLGPDVTICAEASVTFDPQTNPETNTFTWRGIFGAANNTIANTTIKNAVASPLDTAVYELYAQWGACERRDSITVNILRKPVANAGLDTAICNLTYAILRGSSSNLSGPVNYAWTPATHVEFPDQAITRVTPPGNNTTYTYTLTVKDDYGCNFSVSDQVDIRVQPPVPAYAGNDTTAVQGVAHQLFSSGGQDYLWSPAGPLNSATAQNPLATLQADQKFVVRVTDFAGCIGYDTVFIKVYKGPAYYIPNAFTPNGDGLNDIFRPVPAGIVRTEYFRIFNRYGETIFETRQYMKGWDGSFKGKLQPVGAYVWVIKGIDRNGKNVEMKGTVTLVQ